VATACADRETTVRVDVRERTLFLCEGGEVRGRFGVALGVNGVGKQREGDGRTPLGAYPLGAPRASQRYGTFIPVGYPTAAQARRGLTGGAIGIHGPPRAFAWAGRANTAADWTAGCIAVGSDAEIERIAAWLRARRGAGVRIE
jgi:murein L,D-transpeptidase YafK